jgi:hypothetical protein
MMMRYPPDDESFCGIKKQKALSATILSGKGIKGRNLFGGTWLRVANLTEKNYLLTNTDRKVGNPKRKKAPRLEVPF